MTFPTRYPQANASASQDQAKPGQHSTDQQKDQHKQPGHTDPLTEQNTQSTPPAKPEAPKQHT